jgi:hypothetical protein
MEKDAYSKLNELSLPLPATFQIEDLIKEASPNNLYYLRYESDINLPRFVSSQYLSERAPLYRQLAEEKKITQIEEGVVSVIGGCVVTNNSGRYVEIVVGHLSGLLLNGWCYLRAYFEGGKWTRQLLPQKLMTEQLPEGDCVSPAIDLKEGEIERLLSSIENLLQHIQSNWLLEFIVDCDTRVYFVDIKAYSWRMNYASLFDATRSGTMVYKGEYSLRGTEMKYHGEFTLDNLNKVGGSTIICLEDHALLSHFVTYGLRRGIGGITI